jgi:hypothetical protein
VRAYVTSTAEIEAYDIRGCRAWRLIQRGRGLVVVRAPVELITWERCPGAFDEAAADSAQ